jgi:molybdate transport system substrate-binding protein
VRTPLAVVVALLLAATGCSSSSSSSSSSSASSSSAADGAGGGKLTGSITVDAAASLTEAFDTLKSRFEKSHPGTTVKIVYGGSSDLSTQIRQGAPVDVFASASTKNMAALGRQALRPKDFVRNSLEVAVPPGNPARIGSIDDLAKAGVKVAVCDPVVPCGVVAKQVLANAHVHLTPAASLPDVKSTLAAVESGEVDAGLVYVTDVRAARSKVQGVNIDAAVDASTTYPIAALRSAGNPNLANAWVDYVLSAEARAVLRADGFVLP